MPSSRQRGRTLVVVAAAIAVAVAVVWRLGAADRTAADVTADPKLTHVDIVSVPEGAFVIRADDGGVLGRTPLTLSLPKSDIDLSVIVKADGHQDRRVAVPLFSESGRVDVTLTPIDVDAAGGRTR